MKAMEANPTVRSSDRTNQMYRVRGVQKLYMERVAERWTVYGYG
jgi:hypothetical protein